MVVVVAAIVEITRLIIHLLAPQQVEEDLDQDTVAVTQIRDRVIIAQEAHLLHLALLRDLLEDHLMDIIDHQEDHHILTIGGLHLLLLLLVVVVEVVLVVEEIHMITIDLIMDLHLILNILPHHLLIEAQEEMAKEVHIHLIRLVDTILVHLLLTSLLHHQDMDPLLLILHQVVDITIEKLQYLLKDRYIQLQHRQLPTHPDILLKNLLAYCQIATHLLLLQLQLPQLLPRLLLRVLHPLHYNNSNPPLLLNHQI